MRNLLGKKFVDVSASAGAPFSIPLAARGAAFGDLDNDGNIDVVINVLNSQPLILRNNGTKNHWVKFILKSRTKTNGSALGARLSVTTSGGQTQTYDVSGAGSYLSSNDTRINVGLGEASRFEKVEVRWPKGNTEKFTVTGVDKIQTLEEGLSLK